MCGCYMRYVAYIWIQRPRRLCANTKSPKRQPSYFSYMCVSLFIDYNGSSPKLQFNFTPHLNKASFSVQDEMSISTWIYKMGFKKYYNDSLLICGFFLLFEVTSHAGEASAIATPFTMQLMNACVS